MYIVTLKDPAATSKTGDPKRIHKFEYCDSANAHLGILRFYEKECDKNPIAIFPISNILGVIYE